MLNGYKDKMLAVCAELGLKPVWQNMDQVAYQLSKVAHKNPPWSPNYMWGVLRGNSISKKLAGAIDGFLAISDGRPASGIGTEDRQVLANPAVLPPGLVPVVVVPPKPCQRAACPVWYVGWPAQKWCCPECRELDKRGL